jgi:hypothetical protein
MIVFGLVIYLSNQMCYCRNEMIMLPSHLKQEKLIKLITLIDIEKIAQMIAIEYEP